MKAKEKEKEIPEIQEQEPSAPEEQPKKKKSFVPLILCLAAVLLFAAVGAGAYIWHLYDSSGSSEIVADQVYVNDISLSGMTMDEARDALTDIEKSLSDRIQVDIKAGDKDYHLTSGDFSCTFNSDEIFDDILAYSEEKGFQKEGRSYELTMEVDTSNIKPICKKIAEEIHTDPVDAVVTGFDPSKDEMFTIQEESAGSELDEKDLIKKLNKVFENGGLSGKVEATVNEIEPSMTAEYLGSHIVKLSSYSTTSTNNANGNENMRVSLKACNGSIIEPGETWSFNDCTGDSNLEENGYKPAGVIVEGRTETGIGGGICQSSTTIYNAGLLSGMLVAERCCHYYKSTYVDAGRDATIDYGNIDLKLMNPFDYQLFMKCWMKGTDLHCEIYGLENPEFDEIKISTSDPDYFDGGYTVEAWRTYYKDGKKVRSEDLPESTYYTKEPD